jgi:O-antigen ligase
MNSKDYFLGVGLGQFVGWAPTYPELGIVEVHNVLLKTLGEFGIIGFVTLTALVMLSFFRPLLQTEAYRGAILIQFVYLIMAMLHPDLMFTAINVSLVYLALYATTLKPT